jgi:hypothetical protein
MQVLATKGVKMICHPPYSPDLAPADVFLCRRKKSELAGLSLSQDSFPKSWEGVIRTIAPDEFTDTFRHWIERCENYIGTCCDYVRIRVFLN